MFLLTCHGTVLCAMDGQLIHQPAGAAQALRLAAASPTPAQRFGQFISGRPTPSAAGDGPLAGASLDWSATGRAVSVRFGGTVLTATPDGATAQDRPTAGAWETFLALGDDEYADLQFLLGADWVIGSKTVAPAADVALTPGFGLRIGPLAVDLRYNTPLLRDVPRGAPAGSGAPRFWSATLLVDGWRLETIHLYRPLVFYSAARAVPALTQAFLSIQSLLEFGGYDGAVHVITDREHHEFARAVPALAPERLTVQSVHPTDRTGLLAARYCILDWPPAWAFQPLLYLDSDVVCDAPLQPVLAAAASAGRLSAPAELFSPLDSNPGVGANLFREDGVDVAGRVGFNTGTLGIPNLPEFGGAIEAIRTVLSNHSDLRGRGSLGWVDQPVANYVGAVTGLVDTDTLTPFVRHTGQQDDGVTDQRRGLAHFWVPRPDGMAKQDAMLRYMQALRAAP